jgi:hypothetical protein
MTHPRLLLVLASLLLLSACTTAPPPPVAPPPAAAAPMVGLLSAAATSTDKGPSLHNYTELYERLFFPWKDEPIKIFEIGIADGGSLKMWQTYFPRARVFAVDIEPKTMFDNDRVKTLIADQANRNQLQAAVNVAGGDIDVLIDDGGHTMEQQQVSLGFLFKQVKAGGYYVIEDVHTSLPDLWKGYGVDRDGHNTTLRMLENFVRSNTIASTYMGPEEIAYLNAQIESVNISYRPASRSVAAVLKKTG